MPVSTKKFVVISSQVNNFGYRVDTASMDLTQYEKNPIFLYMHKRGTEMLAPLPIGHLQGLEREANGDITATPFFSDNDEFAMQLFYKVEEGTLRMLSAGFEPLGYSEAPEDLMPGQKYATVKPSKLKEVSLVDIGGDDNALALFSTGEILKLDDQSGAQNFIPIINQKLNITNMKEQLIPMLLLVGLTKDGTLENLMSAVADLKTQAETATKTVAEKEGIIVQLNDTIGILQQAATNDAIEAELSQAVLARKITEEQKPMYALMDLPNLKKLFATMPGAPTLQATLANGADADAELLKLTYNEAHKAGKLVDIKAKYPERYNEIYKAKFNKLPTA